MELLPVVCLCLLTRCGITSADGNGPAIVKVEQDSDALLPCSLSTKENIETKQFDWKKPAQKNEKKKEVFYYIAGEHYNNGRDGQSEEFKGRVFHFQEELKHGNASIIIRNTKMADSGDYTCVFPDLQTRQPFHIKLIVGAAPKPAVTTRKTQHGVLLQCEVQGSPQPTVEWQDSAGNVLPAGETQVSRRGGRTYFTVNTTVTRSDDFRCVATQETLSHQIYTEIYVSVNGEIFPDHILIFR
ncbi:butyrophilin subfamily 2 member A2-like [Epinephelus moara]|uniref:butyrophilin subfamily 2 member A2-like n=1 Tax=Epinephelus moara TaxID=300413 RepID=UPI00214F1863|nr:butyrophilin subfamily 2 member A2-like [Epinephelus moara]